MTDMLGRQLIFLFVAAALLEGGPPASTQVKTILLRSSDGQQKTISTDEETTVVIFVSARCPLTWEYFQRIQDLSGDFAPGEVRFLLVNSNSNESDDEVQRQVREFGLKLPIYRDPDQKLAADLGASVTPESVVLDRSGNVRYRGRIDDSQTAMRVHRRYLREAIEAVLDGGEPPVQEAKALGCSIKRAR